jgi:heavy metal sensor kinase
MHVPLPQAPPKTRFEAIGPGLTMYIVTMPFKIEGQDVTVEMGSITTDIETVLRDLRRSLLIGLPLVALIVSAGGYFLVRRSLRVVEVLRSKAEEITFGNLDNRLPVVQSGDSIEHLAVTLNQMLERLSEAYDQANRFSADASHELRTPLTIIRAELESLMRQNGAPGWLSSRLGSVLEETERLSVITEGLFALSRLEAGEGKAREERLDLAQLVTSTVDQMKLLTEDKGIDLIVTADGPVFVQGDPARLKQVIVDLLDNAIKYTPTRGRITLKVVPDGKRALLEVSDTGIGIPAADIPHVFERFYRADKARSRQIDGAGLGLAIVRSICQAHGGSVQIESVEGSGTTCHVHIPLAA